MGFFRYVLPLTIGVGVGASVYFWYNKVRSLVPVIDRTIRVPFKPPKCVSLRVPSHLVPELIGQNGDAIHELEAVTHTSIHFENEVKQDQDLEVEPKSDQSSDDDWIPEPPDTARAKRSAYMGHRVMSIKGDEDGVRQVEQMVNRLISENEVESVPIPEGCNIVGVDGHIINRIRDQSGAKLKIEGNKYTTNRAVIVIGNPEQRESAKALIFEVVDDHYRNQSSDD